MSYYQAVSSEVYRSPGSKASAAVGTPFPNSKPRSCTICRQRKVRCDKRSPCSNCVRSRTSCIYPSPERTPRKPRTPADGDLLERLTKLEGMVQELGKGADQERAIGTANEKECKKIDDLEEKSGEPEGLTQAFGRLLMGDGKSQYLASGLWASLNEQVEDIKEVLNEVSDEEDYAFPESAISSPLHSHDGFLFGFSSLAQDLRGMHPDPTQILFYWQTFKDRVDPMFKVVHIPTTEASVMRAKDDLDSLSKGVEALLFVIYFAVVTSLTQEESKEFFGESKDALLDKYRFCVEQALARAGFLSAQELILLQVLVIFLICVRGHNETRFVWNLTGLAIRIAQSLGLHRDGTYFGLSPFETEMRRRVWWSICYLDLRAAEEYGLEPTIAEPTYDTKLPLNIDDVEISPESDRYPENRLGCTEMTFCLLRFEVWTTIRRLDYFPLGASLCRDRAATFSLQEKEKSVEDCYKRLEERYLKHCDMTVPLHWVTATVARLVMAKMWLFLYHPFQGPGSMIELPQSSKDRLFVTSIEVVEHARLLETQHPTSQWGWMFRTHMHFLPLAYMLAELCNRTKGEAVDRAWDAINNVFKDGGERERDSTGKRGLLWGTLRKLMAKAKRVREAEQARERAIANLDSNPHGPVDSSIVWGPSNHQDGALVVPSTQVNSDQAHRLTALDGESASPSQPDYQWRLNDSGLDIDLEGDPGNWAGWDNLVKDYQMEF